jgi:hypothetical protein
LDDLDLPEPSVSSLAGFIVSLHFKNGGSLKIAYLLYFIRRSAALTFNRNPADRIVSFPTLNFSLTLISQALAHPMTKSNLTVLRDGEDQEGGESEA